MKKAAALILVIILFAPACTKSRTVRKTEPIMGTDVSVTVVADSREKGAAAVDAALAEVKRLDAMMSLYKDTSELTRVNMAAGKHPVKVSPELIDVVRAANRISKLTGGAFDVTVGPLVVLWQMRLKENRIPTDREIALARSRVGYKNIVINRKASTLFLRKPNMILDLGGVAKGYAADRAAEVLRKRGITNAIVAVAGDIRVLGHRADGSSWRIGVQHPRDPDKVLAVLDLSDKYVSTSGDYERFKIVHHKRYHHILDPRTGRPSSGMEAVTLVCDQGVIGDPLTTASFILGPKRSAALVTRLGCQGIFVNDRGEVTMTDGMSSLLEQGE